MRREIEHRIAALEGATSFPTWRTLSFTSHHPDSEAFKALQAEAVARDRAENSYTGNYFLITGFCGRWRDNEHKQREWGLCEECHPHGRCLHDGEVHTNG